MSAPALTRPTPGSVVPPEGPSDVAVRRLPKEFEAYRSPLPQMASGTPGKIGMLDLRFARRGGRTQLVESYATGPQRVLRVLYPDVSMPDLAVVFVQSVGGGVLQGDRYALRVHVEDGARALVTTQSATKVYRMEADYATNRLDVRVEDGGWLELLTDYVIPYRGVRFHTEAEFAVGDRATFVYADGVAAGRVASGERFAYERVAARLRGTDLDGRLRFLDTLMLAPNDLDPARPGVLAGYTDLASMFVVSRDIEVEPLANELNDELDGRRGMLAGASVMPAGDGVTVRVVADSSPLAQAGIHRAWEITRRSVTAQAVPGLHRAKYGFAPRDLGPREGSP